MRMHTVDLHGLHEVEDDYGKKIINGKIKSIDAFISYGTGSTAYSNFTVSATSTHTALSPDKSATPGMKIVDGNTTYNIDAVNPAGRFAIMYLSCAGGVADESNS